MSGPPVHYCPDCDCYPCQCKDEEQGLPHRKEDMTYCGDEEGKKKIRQLLELLIDVEQLSQLPRDFRENLRKMIFTTGHYLELEAVRALGDRIGYGRLRQLAEEILERDAGRRS